MDIIKQQLLTTEEDELIKKVLDFKLRLNSDYVICLKDIADEVILDLSIPEFCREEPFDIEYLKSIKQDIDEQLERLAKKAERGSGDFGDKIITLYERSKNLGHIINNGCKTPLLGSFCLKTDKKLWRLSKFGFPGKFYKAVDLYLDNIAKASRNDRVPRKVVLIATFIHEMFHAWNFFACGKQDGKVREMDEPMVEYETLLFLKAIAEEHNEFIPIKEWAEASVKEKQYAVGDVAAYGFGYYLFSLKAKAASKAEKMLETYSKKPGIPITPTVNQIQNDLSLFYPQDTRKEKKVFEGFYKTIVTGEKLQGKQVWDEVGNTNIVFDDGCSLFPDYLHGIIEYLKEDVIIVKGIEKEEKEEEKIKWYQIWFCHKTQWHKLFDQDFSNISMIDSIGGKLISVQPSLSMKSTSFWEQRKPVKIIRLRDITSCLRVLDNQGLDAFRNRLLEKSDVSLHLEIPNTVNVIEGRLFKGCTQLEEIRLANSVSRIGQGAFEDCSALKEIGIPNAVRAIGSEAFKGCSRLERIIIPDAIRRIGPKAFEGCKSLKEIVIPEGITRIETGLFKDCTSLERITLPDSVSRIGKGAFEDCIALKEIELPDAVATIESEAFKGCSCLESIKTPSSLASIGSKAFEGCKSLKKIVIPDSRIKSIESELFKGCISLGEIILPDSLSKIEQSAFESCASLKRIDIPESVNHIGRKAFEGCSALKAIKVSDAITRIEDETFRGCSSLESVSIPPSVYSIGRKAFDGCSALRELEIPQVLPCIEDQMFKGCSSLARISIPQSVKSIGRKAFEGCSALKELVIPQTITRIEDETFKGCSSLESINIPLSLDRIGRKAFEGCSALRELMIPDAVPSIEAQTFKGCSSLERINIPKQVESIGANAFEGCVSLELTISQSITVHPNAFKGTKIQIPSIEPSL